MPVPSTASATAASERARQPRIAVVPAALAALIAAGGAGAQVPVRPPPVASPPVRAAASTPAPAASGAAYGERFAAVCAACHGATGRSELPGVPVLAGQYPLYAITQLFLFREGRRDNAAMVALAQQMSDADLRGFADAIGRLPPVPPAAPAAPPDAARMRLGAQLAKDYKCTACHGADFAGGAQVPRIGGQKLEYLLHTLRGFKSGQRPGYTRAMTEALSQVPEADLEPLAYFAAHTYAR